MEKFCLQYRIKKISPTTTLLPIRPPIMRSYTPIPKTFSTNPIVKPCVVKNTYIG